MNPKISVVVVILTGGTSLERCLQSLLNQKGDIAMEILVPKDERIEPHLWQEKFPSVRFIPLMGRPTFAQLRSAGFRNATGEIIALTEDQCIPDPDWCASIAESHSASHAAAGGAVEKGLDAGADSALNWSIYFCDYSRYANPLPEGPVQHLTDCNVSYKREKLNTICDLWQSEFHENVIHQALIEKGEQLWFSPRIIVRQQRSLQIREALQERYSFGRLFASTRGARESMLKRIVYAISALLLPVLLTVRIAQNVFGKRGYRNQFVRCLPWILFLNSAWSLGELVGSLTAARHVSVSGEQISA